MAAVIDFIAMSPWYADHARPIWEALPPEARGRFHVSHRSVANARGLPGVITAPLARDPSRAAVAFSFGDMRGAFMAGRQRIALGQHGAGQSYSSDHPAYPGGRSQEPVSLFLVPNDHAAQRTRHRYPRARVEVVGCPKLDTLPRLQISPLEQEPVVAFSFHWDGPGIAPEMRSAWKWYQRAVPAIAKRHKVIGHAHPKVAPRVFRWYREAGIEIVESFAEVLRRADVYACDNSSSLFEFAATGRPVIVLNAPPYRREVEHGLRFWSAAGVGVNADPGTLAEAVETALADPPEVREAREAALDIVYRPRTGGAQLAAAALLDWAGWPLDIVEYAHTLSVTA
jgi:hypothetical protein